MATKDTKPVATKITKSTKLKDTKSGKIHLLAFLFFAVVNIVLFVAHVFVAVVPAV